MAMSRSKKETAVTQYEEGIAAAPHAVVVGFKGITVPQATALRDKIRDHGGTYQVVKNSLLLRAIKGKALEPLSEHFVGPTAVAYINDDPVALAKALTEFRKESPVIEFKGGLVEGQPVSADQVEDIAGLPSRDELLAKLLYLLQSPITRLAQGLSGIQRKLLIALDQIAQQKDN